MYLSKEERKEVISAYDCGNLIEGDHYQVEPDVWVYLFHDTNDKKYVLIVADYIDYYYDVFPHLLKFENSEFAKLEFVLQREIPVKNDSSKEKTANTILFEYTD